MNRIQRLFNERAGIPAERSYDFALKRLCVAKEDSWRGILPSNYSSDYNPEPPIFSAKFANCDGYRHLLAIANEDGKIALQDTTQRNYESEEKALNAPQCHFNAVFDLEWAPGQMKFVSASGDHTARLWEVADSQIRCVNVFNGHSRSVKTAAFRKCDSTVFATGGRDGAICIWDTRANLNVDLTPRADNCIYSGHMGGPGTPVSQRKRLRTPKYAPNATSSSITGLVFQDTNTLISCGAGDGIIKVWDLRRNYTTYKREPLPKHSLPYAGSSTFKGFTNLLIDASGAKLYANCMDNTIYCYNIFSCSPKPLALYKGLLNSTFYIKSCLSPDGKYLLSGSSDEKAYIWNLDYPNEPLIALAGHTVEVTCVAWGATHDRPIVTCSDDARHKIWRIGPEDLSEADKAEKYRGHAEYVRTFGQHAVRSGMTHTYNLRDLESTPRSLKRLVEQNERTPNSSEKMCMKRSFLEMLGAANGADNTDEKQEVKRPKAFESRGRRLFGPSCSTAASCCSSHSPTARCLNVNLSAIPEERCSSFTPTSPLNRRKSPSICTQEERTLRTPDSSPNRLALPPSSLGECSVEHLNHMYTSPPSADTSAAPNAPVASSFQQSAVNTSAIYSPTSNLPNYVVDGEAPHLNIISPKRKAKDKVDWLTKIRKQKLMSSCRGATLSDKINEERTAEHNANTVALSPRLQSLRCGSEAGNPRLYAAASRRRTTHSGAHVHRTMASPTSSQQHAQHPKTPTSSRRNSDTTILRFFSVQQQRNTASASAASTSAADSTQHTPLVVPQATAACAE